MSCPAGLHFRADIRVCDYAVNADCLATSPSISGSTIQTTDVVMHGSLFTATAMADNLTTSGLLVTSFDVETTSR